MNVAALIGQVSGPVSQDGDGVRFPVEVAGGRTGGAGETVEVHARGGQAEACRAFLRPGHRVAVEGRVAPGARPAEVVADRIQFLTTRAEAQQAADAG